MVDRPYSKVAGGYALHDSLAHGGIAETWMYDWLPKSAQNVACCGLNGLLQWVKA